MLQTGRSRVRFPTVSLEFFSDIILLVILWPWGRLSLQQKWVPGVFSGGKGGRCVRLTTLPSSCAVVIKSGYLTSWNPLDHSRPVKGRIFVWFFSSLYLREEISSECCPNEYRIQWHLRFTPNILLLSTEAHWSDPVSVTWPPNSRPDLQPAFIWRTIGHSLGTFRAIVNVTHYIFFFFLHNSTDKCVSLCHNFTNATCTYFSSHPSY
jgi:hypothetical protein